MTKRPWVWPSAARPAAQPSSRHPVAHEPKEGAKEHEHQYPYHRRDDGSASPRLTHLGEPLASPGAIVDLQPRLSREGPRSAEQIRRTPYGAALTEHVLPDRVCTN